MKISAVFSLFIAAACPMLVLSQALPDYSRPTAYHLNIDVPNLGNATQFRASIEISVTMSTPTDSFVLHSQDLLIVRDSVTVERNFRISGWKPLKVEEVHNDGSLLVIKLQMPGVTGDYRLRMDYWGLFRNKMAGFAKIGYHFNRTHRYMAVTNFDPTNARLVFPCYDMPEYRTKFSLNITVDKSQTVLSNVNPTALHDVTDTRRKFVFDRYPELNIHALGWAVLHYSHFQLQSNNSATTVVHTRAPYPYSNHTGWANHLSAGLLAALEKYTGHNCSLSQLEQIIVPEFFTGSAEGWGIISYSEEAILVSPGRSSTRYTQQAALGIARGLVHQWFGDLVSMKTWHDNWLTTGLSEYLKFIITGSLSEMSDWELAEQVVVELVQPALALDVSVHALNDNTHSEDEEVREACDDLTKYKGGAIIYMLHNMLSDNLFKSSLQVYLSSVSGKISSEPEELWNIQYEGAQEWGIDLGLQSVNSIMDEWTSTAGHPTLTVAWNNTYFNISQSTSGRWHIPVTYMLQKTPGVVNRIWLQPGASLTIPSSEPQWILVNIKQTGFYRVNYDTAIWHLLLKQLNTDLSPIPRLSRSQLIDDLFSLALSESLPYSTVLEFTKYLQAETDYYPWRTALAHFQTLLDKMYGHSSYELLRKHVTSLLPNVVSSVSGAPKSHTDKLKKVLIQENACSLNHADCVKKSVSILESWMSSTYFDADQSTSLLCSGVANSSPQVWRKVWSMFRHSVYPSVRVSLLKALVCTRDTQLLKEFLTNITSPSRMLVSSKDKSILLQTLASTPSGAEILLDWLLDRLYIQINRTSTETTTIPTANTSPAPVTSNTTASNDTNVNPASITVSSDQSGPLADNPLTSAVHETLSEEDVVVTLNYILPKLTTSRQALKLYGFVSLNDSGISDTITAVMKRGMTQVNQQADWAIKNNDGITTWLENSLTGPTSIPTMAPSSPTTSTSAPDKSAAVSVLSSVTLCTLAIMITITVF